MAEADSVSLSISQCEAAVLLINSRDSVGVMSLNFIIHVRSVCRIGRIEARAVVALCRFLLFLPSTITLVVQVEQSVQCVCIRKIS